MVKGKVVQYSIRKRKIKGMGVVVMMDSKQSKAEQSKPR
jgi:hypothetical protein